jgi:hypothetical protein
MTGCDVTGSHVTGRDHVRNRKYAMRMRNRKFRNTPSGNFSPEVTGNDRDHGYRRGGRVCACQPEVAQYPPIGPFHRKLATGSDVIFPAHFS